MTDFTPASALMGGAMIGLASLWLLARLGRIAGISGIASGAMFSQGHDRLWRLAFVAGLILAGVLARFVLGWQPEPRDAYPLAWVIVAGLLVGYGTSIGSGCTSGHGVCGIARLSTRSILATVLFMASAAITVFLVRHVFEVLP
jgi:hypothetical protein